MPEVWKVEESLSVLGRNLRTARLRRGLTQGAVAAMAGVSAKTVQKLEAGDPGVALRTAGAVMLALGFGTPFDALCAPEADETGKLLDMDRVPKRGHRLRRDGDAPDGSCFGMGGPPGPSI